MLLGSLQQREGSGADRREKGGGGEKDNQKMGRK